MLQKGVYPSEYIDYWEKRYETSLPGGKEDFYSHLNMGYIVTDADYVHLKRVCKGFKVRHLGDYHNLNVQSNTILLADVFGNFENMYLGIYELDPDFLSTSGLAWLFKKD